MRAKQMIRSVLILNPNIWAFGLDTRRQVNRLLRRPFDHDFTFLKWFHPPDGTEFVDAGANIGEAIEAMRLYHPHIPITAFEPCAATFAKLNNSVGNLENITLIQCALSDVSGSLQ